MNVPNDNTAPKGLRGWWLTPPRSGLRRFISPWEYRHLRGIAGVRIGGAIVQGAAGGICLAYGVYGWAAFFLALAAANLMSAGWELSIARTMSPGT